MFGNNHIYCCGPIDKNYFLGKVRLSNQFEWFGTFGRISEYDNVKPTMYARRIFPATFLQNYSFSSGHGIIEKFSWLKGIIPFRYRN